MTWSDSAKLGGRPRICEIRATTRATVSSASCGSQQSAFVRPDDAYPEELPDTCAAPRRGPATLMTCAHSSGVSTPSM